MPRRLAGRPPLKDDDDISDDNEVNGVNDDTDATEVVKTTMPTRSRSDTLLSLVYFSFGHN